jgi:hypothetical protein
MVVEFGLARPCLMVVEAEFRVTHRTAEEAEYKRPYRRVEEAVRVRPCN